MHNHNDKNNSSMMWMMVPCLLILVFAIFAGGGGLRSWPFLLIIGAMVGGHLWMMFRGHGHDSSGEEQQRDAADAEHASPENTPAASEKKGHSSHSCCH
jgi:hypothetical protein